MQEKLNNLQVAEFLQDFKNNSVIEFLEEGSKETNEILQIAKARGINLKNNRDLSGFKCIYAFTDTPNKNGAILPEKPFLRALPTMIGKPINIGHNRRWVVGHILDYRYQLKEKRAIMYGALYKSNFDDEWGRVQKDFKAKKLNVSFEIWSPKDKRKDLPDGTYELHDQEIAGCAILFRDEEPAFDGARVLALAKKLEEEQPELVYASKYKDDEIIVCEKDKCKTVQCIFNADTSNEIKDIKVIPKEQITTKIKCSNCEEEFEFTGIGDIKCPKCFAILDKTGNMIYPPQIKDFKIICPACKVNRWLVLSKCDEGAKLRCLHCAKEYKVTWSKKKVNELAQQMNFVYIGRATCLQCGKVNDVIGTSAIKIKTVKCKNCGLEYSYDISMDSYKQIAKIEEIESKTSEKGGQKMAEEKKIKVASEETKKDAEKEKVEEKIETPKVEETKTDEKTEKVEEKVEKPEEAKAEDSKEEKVEESKVEDTEEKQPEKAEEKPEVEAKSEDIDKKAEEPSEAEAEDAPKAEETVDTARFDYEIVETEELEDIEVSQKFNCSCIECGYKITTDEHCKDLKCPKCGGQMRRAERPGPGQDAKKLTYQERKEIPDSMFAVVVKVKNKKTGGTRKVRMFPIHDEAHVRNALARLGQPGPQATLKKLGVSVESVRRKILRRARQLKMTQLLERYKSGVKKIANKVRIMRKEIASLREDIEFYKANAIDIKLRREELGEVGKELSDKDILDDKKFAKAKAEIENADIEKSATVGDKEREDYYNKTAKKIDDIAFGRKEKE